MLKLTKQNAELLTNYDKMLMIENRVRGGISQCNNKCPKANNKCMGIYFDKNEESDFIIIFRFK